MTVAQIRTILEQFPRETVLKWGTTLASDCTTILLQDVADLLISSKNLVLVDLETARIVRDKISDKLFSGRGKKERGDNAEEKADSLLEVLEQLPPEQELEWGIVDPNRVDELVCSKIAAIVVMDNSIIIMDQDTSNQVQAAQRRFEEKVEFSEKEDIMEEVA